MNLVAVLWLLINYYIVMNLKIYQYIIRNILYGCNIIVQIKINITVPEITIEKLFWEIKNQKLKEFAINTAFGIV